MKGLSRHLKYCIIAFACVLTLGSCIFDDYTDDGQSAGGAGDLDKAFLVLHVSPVNITRAQDNGNVAEKIESLRIIMLNEIDGKNTIEVNRRAALNMGDFPYSFTHKTDQGKKKFYFIANEDRVTNITYLSQTDADKNKTLKELLDAYKAGDDATAFETWINSVYFEPTYTIEHNEIYLPYTAFYEGTEVKQTSDGKWENLTQPEMYLVPVATKFYFQFYNYHEKEVEIKNLSIKSIASRNFLLGNVDETEQQKVFEGQEKYWVDWLAEVAKKTQDYQLDNEEINEQYGWISVYQLPETNVHEKAVLVSEEKNNVETIQVSTDGKEAPLYLGPYYYPESRYYEESNTTKEEQDYYLNLHLHDTGSAATNEDFNEDLRIGNVKALFRDTYVLITVTMKRGDVEVYAEMAPWEHKEVEGWAEGGGIMQ